MGANTLMALSSGTQAISGAGNAYVQSQALRQQGEYEAQQLDTNAKLADLQKKDALKRGDEQASAVRRKGKETIATQRAVAAASGVAVDSGDVKDAQIETELLAGLDENQVKASAWSQAFGYDMESIGTRSKARMTEATSGSNARNTLITGGLQFLSAGTKAGYYAKGGK